MQWRFFAVEACGHAAPLRLPGQTGGNPWSLRLALASCLLRLVVLSVSIGRQSRPALVWLLALRPVCLGLEWRYPAARPAGAATPGPDRRPAAS